MPQSLKLHLVIILVCIRQATEYQIYPSSTLPQIAYILDGGGNGAPRENLTQLMTVSRVSITK